MIEPCPACWGRVEHGRCKSCGVVIGTAKGVKGRVVPERTIASPGADQLGRPAIKPADIDSGWIGRRGEEPDL